MPAVVALSARQTTAIHGWWNPVPALTWHDIRSKNLTLDFLFGIKIRAADLVMLQPDPREWVKHAGASLKHARQMLIWPANPFMHLGADLADVLSMKLSVEEMIRMGITLAQLKAFGMTDQTKPMFRFSEDEWDMIPSK